MYQCISILHWEWSSGLSPKFHTPKISGIPHPPKHRNNIWIPTMVSSCNLWGSLQRSLLPRVWRNERLIEIYQRLIEIYHIYKDQKVTEILQKYAYNIDIIIYIYSIDIHRMDITYMICIKTRFLNARQICQGNHIRRKNCCYKKDPYQLSRRPGKKLARNYNIEHLIPLL